MGNSPLGSKISGPVLLTGHTGFKGAWFTELLRSLSVEVAGYSLEPSIDALYTKLHHRGELREEFADIRNLEKLSRFIAEIKPEVVFHFAAQPLVLESYRNPSYTFSTNVTGTTNLLEAAFNCDTVKVIVIVTTDKVYENLNLGIKFKETDPLMGKDPYSASKVAAEQAVSAWRQIKKIQGGPSVISVRAGNVIGGGDVSSDRLMPDLVRAFTRGEKVTIRNPKSTRPWQHVLDPLVGYLQAADFLLNGDDIRALNFSNNSPSLTVNEVVEIATKSWGRSTHSLVKIQSDSWDETEAETLDLDSSLAESKMGWSSKWSQSEAVISTIEWWTAVNSRDKSPKEACQFDLETLARKFSV